MVARAENKEFIGPFYIYNLIMSCFFAVFRTEKNDAFLVQILLDIIRGYLYIYRSLPTLWVGGGCFLHPRFAVFEIVNVFESDDTWSREGFRLA